MVQKVCTVSNCKAYGITKFSTIYFHEHPKEITKKCIMHINNLVIYDITCLKNNNYNNFC